MALNFDDIKSAVSALAPAQAMEVARISQLAVRDAEREAQAPATVDARDFGIYPGSGNAITSSLRVALNQAAAANSRVVLQSGQYNYDNTIDVTGGGGMVCLNGFAQLNAQHPNYNRQAISFNGASEANRYVGFNLEGIVFNNATRPDSGLANDADENATFIRLTNIRDVYVARNRVIKNYGGFILLRNVDDALIERNVCKDLWKDVFHTTDASNNVWRMRNAVVDCGDDAFATVGYIYRGVRPMFIYDFDNYVYGCRKARAFAYVGCAHVRHRGFVDGRVMEAPQITSTDGYYYRGNCALYIGSEYSGVGSTYNTYGVDDIEAHIDAQHMGPIVSAPGAGAVAATGQYGINSYEPVHIVAAGQPHSGVKVRGTLRSLAKGGIFVGGADGVFDPDIDLKIIDNTDPDGWRGAAGTFATRQAEFQYIRGNSKLSIDATTCNTVPMVVGNTARGDVAVGLKINDICKTVVNDALFVESGATSGIDTLSIDLDVDYDIPAGRADFLLDLSGSAAAVANQCLLNLRGKGSVNNVAAVIRGAASQRSIALTGSPQILVNSGDEDVFLQIKDGTISNVEVSRILSHHGRVVASVADNVLTIVGDVTSFYPTTRHVAFLGSDAQFDMTTAIAISAVSFSGGNTSITLASAPPVATSYARVAPVYTDGFLPIPDVATAGYRRILKLGKNRAMRITYSVAPTINVVSARQ